MVHTRETDAMKPRGGAKVEDRDIARDGGMEAMSDR